MTPPDDHPEPETPTATDGISGKHARNTTPETSAHATEEVRRLGDTQPTEPATEYADKSKPPEGKPSKPA